MKKTILLFIILLISQLSICQKIISGNYEMGMSLAYDPDLNLITGYFENYTGWDETLQSPRFSCVFYMEGKIRDTLVEVKTYHPAYKAEDIIMGKMEVVDSLTIKIKLSEEHGGCWNVQHFSEEPIRLTLEQKHHWIQIRYVDTPLAFFYKEKTVAKKTKRYLIKGNTVCVEKIENGWAYCIYFGEKKNTTGWLKISDLNSLP